MRVLTQNISSLKSQAKREKIAAYYAKEISKNNDCTFFLKTHIDLADEEDFTRLAGLRGYPNHIHFSPPDGIKGGMVLLINKHLNISNLEVVSSNKGEFICTKFRLNDKTLFRAAFYGDSSACDLSSRQRLFNFFTTLKTQTTNYINCDIGISGDFNFTFTNSDTNANKRVKKTTTENLFKQIIKFYNLSDYFIHTTPDPDPDGLDGFTYEKPRGIDYSRSRIDRAYHSTPHLH